MGIDLTTKRIPNPVLNHDGGECTPWPEAVVALPVALMIASIEESGSIHYGIGYWDDEQTQSFALISVQGQHFAIPWDKVGTMTKALRMGKADYADELTNDMIVLLEAAADGLQQVYDLHNGGKGSA